MTILLTGCAGFIGFHCAQKLLNRGDTVIGIDSLNDYYDPTIKTARLQILQEHQNFYFYKQKLEDEKALATVFTNHTIDRILHLAAQAGVRYSIDNPHAYINANIVAFENLLEAARHNPVQNFVYASSSSVYGLNEKTPFRVDDPVNTPISLYAASKRSNELMAHVYHHLFNIPLTGLRYFTVYGPWGRPDMALFKFTKGILEETPIDIFNNGDMIRNFTYIDDVVKGSIAALDTVHNYEIFNIGNDKAEKLMDFIEAIEDACGKKAIKNMLPMQPGDVSQTIADITHTTAKLNYNPNTDISEGIPQFVQWFTNYYRFS